MREVKSIFGVNIEELRRRSKKYRLVSAVIYAIDALLLALFTAFMFYHYFTYEWYGYTLVVLCLLVNMIIYYKVDTGAHEAYKFYKRNRNGVVETMYFRMAWIDVFETCKSCGIKVVSSQTIPELKACIQQACLRNPKLAKKFMKLIMQCKCESSDFACLVLQKGKASYLVDFIEEDSNGNHYEGTVEEPCGGDESERGSSD